MAPSTLGPSVQLKDASLTGNHIFMSGVRLKLDMSLTDDSVNPSDWSGTQGKVGSQHPCICITVSSDSDSMFSLEFLMMRSFGATDNPRATVARSSISQRLLPLPFSSGETPQRTPASFGEPLKSPQFEPMCETWVMAQVLRVDLAGTTKVSYTSWGWITLFGNLS